MGVTALQDRQMNYLMPFVGGEGTSCILRHSPQGLEDTQSTHCPKHTLLNLLAHLLQTPEGWKDS